MPPELLQSPRAHKGQTAEKLLVSVTIGAPSGLVLVSVTGKTTLARWQISLVHRNHGLALS